MDSGTKCSDHCLDLGIGINLIQSCLLYIQDLTTQWKDSLCCTVTCCLRRTAGGISLYDVDLAVLRILSEQSASFPGSAIVSSADFLLLVRSLAFLAASLARWAITDFSTDDLYQRPDSAQGRSQVSCSLTTLSTAPLASLLPSFCLVCPSNCGSSILTLMIAVRPLTDIFTGQIRLIVF